MDFGYSTALAKQISQFELRTELPLHIGHVQRVRRWVYRYGLFTSEPEMFLVINYSLAVLAWPFQQILFTYVTQP
jgi:hypothetical protein